MKVYLFYTPYSRSVTPEDTSRKELYAITNNKKLYKTFKQTRDMSKFTVKMMDISKEEYAQMASPGMYRECVLEWGRFEARKKNPYPKDMNKSFGKSIREFYIPATYLEVQSVQEACNTFLEHTELSLPPQYIFHKQLKRIFVRIGMTHIYNLTRLSFIGDDYMYCTEEEVQKRSSIKDIDYASLMHLRKDLDYNMPMIWVDHLEVFIYIYGHLLKL